MYVYLYDTFLTHKAYDETLKEVETRLTDFGIAGKIIRLQKFTNCELVIEEEIRRGATTIIIVGDDHTFGRVLSRAATCDILFGFLPMGKENSIAHVLGIPIGVDACDVLARRRKIHLDVGWVNNRYFISQLHILAHDIRVTYDEQFSVSSLNKKMELVVCNLQPFVWKGRGKESYVVHPQDGKLEAFLRPVAKKRLFSDIYEEPSIFPFEEMEVVSDTPFEVISDGYSSKEKKIAIRLAKNKISMVVGKERSF